MKRSLPAFLIAAILAGCTAAKAPAPVPAPAPSAALPHPVTHPANPASNYLPATPPDRVPNLQHGEGWWSVPNIVGLDYLWRADGGALAFRNGDGIWSVTADGSKTEQIVAGDTQRILLRYDQDGLLWLEGAADRAVVVRGRPGTWPAVVAAVPMGKVAPPLLPNWYRLAGDSLLLLIPAQPVREVSLTTGAVRQVTAEPLSITGAETQLSPDRRYLTYRLNIRGGSVQIIDLETGTITPPGRETHLESAAWSPAADRWAVRAAEPGANPAAAQAAHLDVGDPAGNVQHIPPPEPLMLTGGPFWSPDGARLAVLATPMPGSDPVELSQAVWLLNLSDDSWTKVPAAEAIWLTGWSPDGSALEVQAAAGGYYWLPLSGDGRLEPAVRERVSLPDGAEVAVMSDFAVVLRRPGQPPAPLMAVANTVIHGLTVQGRKVAYVLAGQGRLPELFVLEIR